MCFAGPTPAVAASAERTGSARTLAATANLDNEASISSNAARRRLMNPPRVAVCRCWRWPTLANLCADHGAYRGAHNKIDARASANLRLHVQMALRARHAADARTLQKRARRQRDGARTVKASENCRLRLQLPGRFGLRSGSW